MSRKIKWADTHLAIANLCGAEMAARISPCELCAKKKGCLSRRVDGMHPDTDLCAYQESTHDLSKVAYAAAQAQVEAAKSGAVLQ
jgi:hypothetical protein